MHRREHRTTLVLVASGRHALGPFSQIVQLGERALVVPAEILVITETISEIVRRRTPS
jgi:hypothetical protein